MASIPTNYEINVAKKRNPDDQYGLHYCRIELSETRRDDAVTKFKEIRKMFGKDYNVTLMLWECHGYGIEVNEDAIQ